jgi:hypothetical protein
MDYLQSISFNEVLLELPALTFEQRQLLICDALKLDDAPLSAGKNLSSNPDFKSFAKIPPRQSHLKK